MPRRAPEHRFRDLVGAATGVFIAQGYRLTQMADVAAALGVAKGTLYLYVRSKEALLTACLRFADAEAPDLSELDLPLDAPAPEHLADEVRTALAEHALPQALAEALARESVEDARREFADIVEAIFALMERHRTVIKLIDACARDFPELAAAFYGGGRYAQVDALAAYLKRRSKAGALRSFPDAKLAARFAIETIATWAVHVHWDPAPQPYDPAEAKHLAIATLVRAFASASEENE